MKSNRVFAPQWSDYELVDAGNERKLERWGNVFTIRPERQAYFPAAMSAKEWDDSAHWEFLEAKNQKGTWKKKKNLAPEKWSINRDNLKFGLELTKFKHLGLFPEQIFNWQKLESVLQPGMRFLNLFAYTGASSLVARNVGAEVIHCEAMKQLVDWSAKNQERSGVEGIKWVVDDALKFATREVKRGNQYDVIQMDPPAFGIGAKGEKWILEDKIDLLLELGKQLLRPSGLLILNTYSPQLPIDKLTPRIEKFFGTSPELSSGLWLKSTTGKRMYTGDVFHLKSN